MVQGDGGAGQRFALGRHLTAGVHQAVAQRRRYALAAACGPAEAVHRLFQRHAQGLGVFFDGTAVPTVQGTAEIAEFGLDGGQQPLQGGRRKAGRCRTTVVTGIGQVR